MDAIKVLEGRNLQTEVLLRMTVDQLNAASESYRPDLRATPADVMAWVNIWNRGGHYTVAHVMDCADHLYVSLRNS